MKMRDFLSVLILAASASALTDGEIAQFEARFATNFCDGNTERAVSFDDTTITFKINGIPDHDWGCQMSTLPVEFDMDVTVPRYPAKDDTGPWCLASGMIGIALNGVVINDALNSNRGDAVVLDRKDMFDECSGHSSSGGRYHYHKVPSLKEKCNPMYNEADEGTAQLVGVAKDGFPIYTPWSDIDTLTDLDECHGITMDDGSYRYVASWDDGTLNQQPEEFPYIIGCYQGDPGRYFDKVKCENMTAHYTCACQNGGAENSDGIPTIKRELFDLKALNRILRVRARAGKRRTLRRHRLAKKSHHAIGYKRADERLLSCFNQTYADPGCECLDLGDNDPYCL